MPLSQITFTVLTGVLLRTETKSLVLAQDRGGRRLRSWLTATVPANPEVGLTNSDVGKFAFNCSDQDCVQHLAPRSLRIVCMGPPDSGSSCMSTMHRSAGLQEADFNRTSEPCNWAEWPLPLVSLSDGRAPNPNVSCCARFEFRAPCSTRSDQRQICLVLISPVAAQVRLASPTPAALPLT